MKISRSERTATVVTLDFPSADLAEFMGRLGCDAVAVDLEHVSMSAQDLSHLARACAVAGTDLVGRTRCREDRILTCLDAGITALELTEVERVDEIDDVVRWASFPPDGSRGIGRARANHYGHVDGGYRRFVESARQDGIDLIVHIETVQAVHEIKEIAAHPWVTALVVGAHDLAASAGHPGDPGNPVVRELIDRAIAAIRASEVGLGLSASSAADARAARDRGADLLLISQARLLSGALASVTDAVRQEQS